MAAEVRITLRSAGVLFSMAIRNLKGGSPLRLSIAIGVLVALPAAAFAQAQPQRRDFGQAGEDAKKTGVNVINVGTAVEGNSMPFGWTDVAHYRQYYGP